MRIVLGLLVAGALVGTLALRSEASHLGCHTGDAAGFLTIRADPPHLVGTIPSGFTDEARFFQRRYNCLGRSAQVRRVDLGVYDVRFPGLSGRAALVSAVSQEAVTASVDPLVAGVYRVALRGPLVGNDVASRRDVAFSVVIY